MKSSFLAVSAVAFVLLASAGVAAADTVVASCTGTPGAASVAWSASATGGTAPYSFLWSNNTTGASQTVNEVPGTYSMTVQATDSSSTPATSASSTCSATVTTGLPAVSAFTATPASILVGGSSVLAWTVTNASSTAINNGVGTISSSSTVVSPTVTTTYTLTATNPNGSVTSNATVTVGTTTSSDGSTLQDKIKALLQQINALQSQLAQLIAGHFGGIVDNPGHIPPGQIGKIACIELGRNLHHGDKGDDVTKLQQMLGVSATGFFGPLTANAMMHFQMQNGIASSTDGSVGPLTRGFFSRSCGKGLSDQHGNVPLMHPTHASSTEDVNDDSASSSQDWTHGNGNSGNNGNHGNPHDY